VRSREDPRRLHRHWRRALATVARPRQLRHPRCRHGKRPPGHAARTHDARADHPPDGPGRRLSLAGNPTGRAVRRPAGPRARELVPGWPAGDAELLRAAHRSPDRRRDVSGAGGGLRADRWTGQLRAPTARGLRTLRLGPGGSKPQCEPDERRASGERRTRECPTLAAHRRPGRQPAAQRGRLVPRRPARADSGSLLGQAALAVQPMPPGGHSSTGGRAQRTRGATRVHRRPGRRRLPGSEAKARRLLGSRRACPRRQFLPPLPRVPGPDEQGPDPLRLAGHAHAVVRRPRQSRRSRAGQPLREPGVQRGGDELREALPLPHRGRYDEDPGGEGW
jgi:hypothetical protein